MKMRDISKTLISLFAAAIVLVACNTEIEIPDVNGLDIPAGDIPVRFKVALPVTDGDTRAGMLDSEPDPAVTTLQMLCFDAYGYFVGARMATTVNSAGATPDHGTYEGSVPEVTARIHFIGNRELILSNSFIGQDENVLMHSEATSTLYSSAPKMVYWGYHREPTPAAMKTWLKPTSVTNTVYLVRDRAQVQLGQNHDPNIESVQGWILSNGRERGYIAPYNQEHGSGVTPFDGYESVIKMTEYSTGGRYAAQESKLAAPTEPLYLFEDINSLSADAANTVKVILKIKYKNITNPCYQVVLLQDKDKVQFKVTRGHIYVLNIAGLPYELGHETFAEAVATTSFASNQMVSVAEKVSRITNGEVEMDINDGETSVIYQSTEDNGRVVTVPFLFRTMDTQTAPFQLDVNGNHTTAQMSMADFSVSVNNANGALSGSSDVSITDYNQTTGIGHLQFKLGNVSSSLRDATITISDKQYGMSRVINIYSIFAFQLVGTPTLTKVDGTVRTVAGKGNLQTYKLSLTLPGNYPIGLYPITLKMATSTLNPYSDEEAGTASGTFGVVVESTTDLSSSSTNTAWNYNAYQWGHWYTYTIASKEVDGEGNPLDTDKAIDIYFDDVSGSYSGNGFREHPTNDVGLYLKIQYFGAAQAFYVTK